MAGNVLRCRWSWPPTRVEDGLAAVGRSRMTLRELRIHGTVTEVMFTTGVAKTEIARRYHQLLASSLGNQVPAVVTGVIVDPPTRAAPARPNASSVPALPGFGLPVAKTIMDKRRVACTPGCRPPWTVTRGTLEPGRAGVVLLSPVLGRSAPTNAFPRVIVEAEEGQVRALNYQLWPKDFYTFGSDIVEFAFDRGRFDDFGYELDIRQYNTTDNLLGIRPLCNRLDNDSRFWAIRTPRVDIPEIVGWFSNVPIAAPYFDYNDATDSCDNLDLSIGIGRPGPAPDRQLRGFHILRVRLYRRGRREPRVG
jgi:hypothetical protein